MTKSSVKKLGAMLFMTAGLIASIVPFIKSSDVDAVVTRKLVNGDFEYTNYSKIRGIYAPNDSNTDTYIEPSNKVFYYTNRPTKKKTIPGFSTASFGWSSTQPYVAVGQN